jgi:hypothetical protein
MLNIRKRKNNGITQTACLLSFWRTVNLHVPNFCIHLEAHIMFLLEYINQLYTAFFVLNDASKVCESRDPILLPSQCKILGNYEPVMVPAF